MTTRTSIFALSVIGLLSVGYLLSAPHLARAQRIEGPSQWQVLDVSTAINRALEANKANPELREKVVLRFAECSVTYGALFRVATTQEAKNRYLQTQAGTMEVQTAIAQQLPLEKYKEITSDAQKSTAVMLNDLKGHEKELAALLRSCKSLNQVNEINNALKELSAK